MKTNIRKGKPKFFFDYIYYRVAEFYIKWDGRNGITALLAIVMMQCLFILTCIGVLYKSNLITNEPLKYVLFHKAIVYITCGASLYINYKKYYNKYFTLRSYWKNDSPIKRRLKGLLVILVMVLSWVPVILLGTVFRK